MRQIFIFVFSSILLFSFSTFAQQNIEMADVFYSEGKIYVVIAVVAIIFIGIIGYLVNMELRLAKLEKEEHELKK